MQQTQTNPKCTFVCVNPFGCIYTWKSHWAWYYLHNNISHKGSNIYILFILVFRCLFTRFVASFLLFCCCCCWCCYLCIRFSLNLQWDYSPSAWNRWKIKSCVAILHIALLLLVCTYLMLWFSSSHQIYTCFSFVWNLQNCIILKQTYCLELCYCSRRVVDTITTKQKQILKRGKISGKNCFTKYE